MMPWWTVIPFVVILVSIAALPLIPKVSHWWEQPRHQLLVALTLGLIACAFTIAYGQSSHITAALVEYFQFIVLLFGLFVVSGGIALTGDLAGSPKVNTMFMGVGAVLASLIGTTGAAMLLIRPMLASNGHRRYRAHTVIFSIFILANCGGLLTPLGDPPLFLGLLKGVPFTWTFGLWREWLFVNGLLLFTYFCLDSHLTRREDSSRDIVEKLGVKGKIQILWFAAIIAAVAFAPSTTLAVGASWWQRVPWRELVILAAAGLSWATSHREARFTVNEFTWAPIREVAILFVGIFAAMVPALVILDEHASSLPLNSVTYHLFTGVLSSVLDNTPTYATFFEVARAQSAGLGDVALVAGVPAAYLVAISTGAVFWGAMTYIGNGPNFMVRSVAQHAGVAMPSFLGYIVWSARWLLPVLLVDVLVFVCEPWWAKLLGAILGLALVARGVLLLLGRGLKL